jgi:hypothetical protein
MLAALANLGVLAAESRQSVNGAQTLIAGAGAQRRVISICLRNSLICVAAKSVMVHRLLGDKQLCAAQTTLNSSSAGFATNV